MIKTETIKMLIIASIIMWSGLILATVAMTKKCMDAEKPCPEQCFFQEDKYKEGYTKACKAGCSGMAYIAGVEEKDLEELCHNSCNDYYNYTK